MVERAVPNGPEWAQLAAPHIARYLFAVSYAHGRRVLDAGTGAGYGAALLRDGGAAFVQGVDVDPATLEQARQQFGGLGIEFLQDDCEELGRVAPPFNVVCSFEAVEHLERPERFLSEAARCMAADGVLLISTPDRAFTPPFVRGKPRNPYHRHEWYQDEFSDLLATFFQDVDLRIQIQTTALGTRMDAVDALRRRLIWGNPLVTAVWRRLPLFRKRDARHWRRLAGLAAPTPADYPIVVPALAPVLGSPSGTVLAICRRPVSGVG